MRTLVLLSLGRNAIEEAGPAPSGEPQPHWREVALQVGGDIASWETARARRGPAFDALFRSRPIWGSAASAAMDAAAYDRIYALDEDVGFRAALLLRARGWKGRLVCLVHCLTPKRRRIVELLGERPFHHFFTYAETQRDALVGAGVRASVTTTAAIPVDSDFFAPAVVAARPVVVAVGAADRDYPTLFAAAAMIDAEIQVFGHGYAGANAAGVLRDVPPNVRLMPHVPVPELRDHMARAHVAVLPLKPVNYAAGATVLIESMSVGLPVAFTDIPGLGCYKRLANPGPAVPAGGPDALARAVNALLADPAAARGQGMQNRDWVVRNARVQDFAARVAAVLRDPAP